MPSESKQIGARSVWPWVIILLILVTGPYLLAWALAPPGHTFTGTLVNPDDLSVYLSAMRQGSAGHWRFHFTFSLEPWQPRLMLVPYLLTGKLMGLVGGEPLVWFHLLRITAVLFAVAVLVYWTRELFPGRSRLQLTAWLLIVFGGGLGWLTMLWLGESAPAPDLLMPELTTFMAFFHTPHFALGVGLETILMICVLRMIDRKDRWRWTGAGALVSLLLGLTYVYHIPVGGLVIGVFLLGRAWHTQEFPWHDWGRGAIVLIPLTLLLFYYGIWSYRDPYFADYARDEHVIPAPPPWSLAVGLGLIGLLALSGLRKWFREDYPWLVPIWAGANLLALYLPLVDFTGRFALGLFVPVATLAAFGLESVVLPWLRDTGFFHNFARFSSTPYASLRRVIILLIVPSTILLPSWTAYGAKLTPGFPYYLPAGEVRAATWLGEHTDEEARFLAYYPIGNYLPRVAAGKVFVGQLDYTTNLWKKIEELETFWDEKTTAAWRSDFLSASGVTHIYVGQYEREIMTGETTPPGRLVYEADGVTIYQMAPD